MAMPLAAAANPAPAASPQMLQQEKHLFYAERVTPRRALRKTVDEAHHLRCKSGAEGLIRIEIWQDEQGRVARYNLAFIQHELCQRDHGRVLGYDNAHGVHERHWMGVVSQVETFRSYEETEATFFAEVARLKETA